MRELLEVNREVYGHDERAINRHSVRTYCDQFGMSYMLSRCLDGCPPFFEAYGPYEPTHVGVLPHLSIDGQTYWGNGWPWKRAVDALCRKLEARLVDETTGQESRKDDSSEGAVSSREVPN